MNDPLYYMIFSFADASDWGDDEADAVYEAFDGEVEFGSCGDITTIEVPIYDDQPWQHLSRFMPAARGALPQGRLIRIEVRTYDDAELAFAHDSAAVAGAAA